MPTKEEAKGQLANLISEFNKNPRKDHLSEEETREFISELFKILGWHFKTGEVTQEEKVSKGYVDYGFRLNNVPAMFVEAKKTSADLQDERWVNQAIDYAWHKATTWAVLTNFKRIRIFNSYIRESLRASQLRDIELHEYLDQFDYIWLLSRESFETKLIDHIAEKEGKKAKEKPVEKVLFEDINSWREELAKDVKKNYAEKYSTEEIDEMVQTLLDRFILVRKIEDEGLEGKKLEAIFHNWLDAKNKKSLWMYLRELFTTAEDSFDQVYDSRIFEYSEVDKLEISDYPLKIILQGLYESEDKTIRYNFAFIDADILGNIYEQYLGYLLKTTAKRATGGESKSKRKEQGIYYTPRYIVDYIVKNTLGEKLKDCKSWEDVEKIKVLDPACGSGSFLIRAFDEIHGWYKEKGLDLNKLTAGESGFETVKDKILKKNIYGVDLDQKAVDIAQLNLLLKTADKKHRLPQLRENIKCGNSLIDDEKVAGGKAFNWNGQFKEIMESGGFDVVIGNPPYVRQEELLPIKPHFQKNYQVFHSMADLFIYFFEKEIGLLKGDGYFGMIVSNKWLKAGYGEGLRKFLGKYWIEQFIDFGDLQVFEGATTYPCILIMKKRGAPNPKMKICQVKTLSFDSLENYAKQNSFEMSQKELNTSAWNFQNTNKANLLQKIKSSSVPLKDYVGKGVYRGILTGLSEAFVINEHRKNELIREDKKSAEIIKPFLTGKEVQRYYIENTTKFLIFTRRGTNINNYPSIKKHLEKFKLELTPKTSEAQKIGRKPGNYKWFEIQDTIDYHKEFDKPKLIYGAMTTAPRFTIDTEGYYANNANFFIPTADKKLLGILNSKLGWFLVANTCTEIRGGYQLIWKYFGNVLIAKANSPELEKLVDKMLSLNKRLNELVDKQTNESQGLTEEIARTDAEIDDLVYKLYGITAEERKIIEDSLGAK